MGKVSYSHVVAVAEARHALVTIDMLDNEGIGRAVRERWISQGRLVAVHPAVWRIAGAPVTWEQRVLAACLWGFPTALASHRSAARLHDLDGIHGADAEVVEISVTPRRAKPFAGVRIHETKLLDPEPEFVRRIPVTSIERTLVDLGAVVSRFAVEHGLDSALRRGLTSVELLEAHLDEVGRRGRNGAGVLRELLAARAPGVGPESVLERKFLRVLERAGIPAPVLQYELHDQQGGLVARIDAAWPPRRVGAELDGLRHHSGRIQRERDLHRQNAVVLQGWTLLRFTWEDVRDRPEWVVATVHRALAPVRSPF